MINKTFYNNGKTCRVTFRYCPETPVDSVYLVSDLDDWDTASRPMTRRKDGCFSTSVVLRSGTRLQFRYLADGRHWINDDHADDYVSNIHGEADGIISV